MNFSFLLVLHHVFFLVLRPSSQDLRRWGLRSFGLRLRPRRGGLPLRDTWTVQFLPLLVAVRGFYLLGFPVRDHRGNFGRSCKLAARFVMNFVRFSRHPALFHVGAFFGCTSLLLLWRRLWCPVAILRDRFSRQDDWRVSGGGTEI